MNYLPLFDLQDLYLVDTSNKAGDLNSCAVLNVTDLCILLSSAEKKLLSKWPHLYLKVTPTLPKLNSTSAPMFLSYLLDISI